MSLNLNKTDRELEEEYQEAVISGQRNDKNVKVILFTVLLIVITSIPLIIGYFAYQIYSVHTRLNNGTRTTAFLDNNYTKITSNRSRTKYKVSYTFSVDGKTYSGENTLPQEPKSKTVAIIYDLTDPTNNKLEGGKDTFEEIGETIILALVLGVVGNLFVWGLNVAGKFSFRKSVNNESSTSNSFFPQNKKTQSSTPSNNFTLSSEKILWIEKELLRFNKEMWGEDRPPHNLEFQPSFPQNLLKKENLSVNDVAEIAINLVNETRKRINKLEVPFRKPRVEFTSSLPNREPGHIEFDEYETIIRIHPEYKDNPFALASILCHELAHFILDHNGLRKQNENENEKMTDLFVFVCGQGLIYLQGIFDVTSENSQVVESKLGYLSLEEMAYAHVRCSAQHGLSSAKIAPDYYKGKVFEEVKKAIHFLQIKSRSSESLAEIILCPKNHILRISAEKQSQQIRCPKCKWEKEIWLHRIDQEISLMNKGNHEYNAGDFNSALEIFRKVQTINKTHSMSYCLASRCLKKLGKKQDAIRELQKLLSFRPNDKIVQDEMKKLIYN